mmetsp:Transcript_26900/g.31062  ORF Transcript_26900/g.31062 Transcript_26900/m.31062 type:complete len:100 (-) Transcript_26900:15-314(-)
MGEITRFREGSEIDWKILRKTILSFMIVSSKKNVTVRVRRNYWTSNENLAEYSLRFETLLLGLTREYYTNKRDCWLQSRSCPEYIETVHAAFITEGVIA